MDDDKNTQNLPIIPQNLPQNMTVDELKQQVDLVKKVIGSMMQQDKHYGKIPGCGPKPTLLKPGAELLLALFRLRPDLIVNRELLEEGHREFSVTCTLKDSEGNFRGQGVGSCSTMERKYAFRRGGEPNPNIADTYNTVLKMAKKRALMDAVLTNTAASEFFTQDIEDDPDLYRDPADPEVTGEYWDYTPPFSMKDQIKKAGAKWVADSKVWRSGKELPQFAQYLIASPHSDVEPEAAEEDDVPEHWDTPPPVAAKPVAPKSAAKPQGKPTVKDRIKKADDAEESFNL